MSAIDSVPAGYDPSWWHSHAQSWAVLREEVRLGDPAVLRHELDELWLGTFTPELREAIELARAPLDLGTLPSPRPPLDRKLEAQIAALLPPAGSVHYRPDGLTVNESLLAMIARHAEAQPPGRECTGRLVIRNGTVIRYQPLPNVTSLPFRASFGRARFAPRFGEAQILLHSHPRISTHSDQPSKADVTYHLQRRDPCFGIWHAAENRLGLYWLDPVRRSFSSVPVEVLREPSARVRHLSLVPDDATGRAAASPLGATGRLGAVAASGRPAPRRRRVAVTARVR